jgi:hypothetical protein
MNDLQVRYQVTHGVTTTLSRHDQRLGGRVCAGPPG